MKAKLNEIKSLVENLNKKIIDTNLSGRIELIEADIIQDILKRVYVLVDELKNDIKSGTENTIAPSHNQLHEDKPGSKFIEEVPVMTFPKVEIADDLPVNQPNGEHSKPEVHYQPVPDEVRTQPIHEQPHDNVVTSKTVEPVQTAPVEVPTQSEVPVQPAYTQEETFANVKTMPSVMNDFQEEVKIDKNKHQPSPAPPASIFSKPATKKQPASNDLFGGQTIADKLKSEAPSLNERIVQGKSDQSLAHKLQLKPISDLKTAIGINEKFQFVNDLFDGRVEVYNDAISKLNNCNSGNIAESILEEYRIRHNWKESEAYDKLKTFVTRRYI